MTTWRMAWWSPNVDSGGTVWSMEKQNPPCVRVCRYQYPSHQLSVNRPRFANDTVYFLTENEYSPKSSKFSTYSVELNKGATYDI